MTAQPAIIVAGVLEGEPLEGEVLCFAWLEGVGVVAVRAELDVKACCPGLLLYG